MAGANRFNVGSSKPWDVQEGVKQLLERFYDLSQRLANIGHTAARVANQFQTLEHMVGRFSASLMLTLGVPRVMRSDLYHAVAGGTGGGRGGGGGTGGGGAGYSGPKSLDDWRSHFDKKYQADTEERVKWAKVAKEQIDEIYGRTKDKTKAIDPEALGKKILDKESEVATKEQLLERLKERASSETNPEEKRKLRNRELKLSGTLTLLKAELTKLQEQKGGLPTPPGAPPPSQGGTPSGGGGFDWGGAWKGVKGAWGSLKEAADKVSYAFLGLAAGAQSLLRAASPDLFSTFTGSVQLLASEVGATLVPTFVRFAATLQGWAKWFAELDGKTKKSVGKVAELVLVMTGLVAVAKLGITAFGALFSKAGLLAGAFGAAITTISVFRQMRHDQRDTAARLREAKDKSTLTREEMESMPDFLAAKAKVEERLSKVPPGPHKGAISEQLFWEEAVRLGQQSAEALGKVNRMDTHGGLHFLNKLGIMDLKSGASPEEVRESLLAFAAQKQRAATALMAYGKSGFPVTASSPKTEADRANMASNLLLNFQSFRAQPRYSSVEEAYKNVQIEAIGKSPLEQALDRQLGQRLDQLLKEAQKANLLTEQQAQETRQMMGRN